VVGDCGDVQGIGIQRLALHSYARREWMIGRHSISQAKERHHDPPSRPFETRGLKLYQKNDVLVSPGIFINGELCH
jgi:hypothetical protein